MTWSSTAVGLLLVCYTGPVVVGGLLAGSLLDRYSRRFVMMVDNMIRGIAVASIPLLNFFRALSLWELYTVALVYGFFFMTTLAGSPAIFPELVDDHQLPIANSLETLSFTLSGVLGAPIAGLIIAKLSAPSVMIVDAASYLAFVLALASIRLPSRVKQTESEQENYTIGDALKLLFSNRILLSTTLMFMAFNVGEGILGVFLPIMSVQVLNGGAELYGFLLGTLAVGQVVGAFIGGSVSFRKPLGTLICICQVASGLSVAIIYLEQSSWLTFLSLFLLGLFSAPLTIWAQTLRMRIIPEKLRGRTFALLRTLMQGALPSGSAGGGFLLPVVGLTRIIGFSACVIGLPGLFGYKVGNLRHNAGSTLKSKLS
jgi:MFS family permease